MPCVADARPWFPPQHQKQNQVTEVMECQRNAWDSGGAAGTLCSNAPAKEEDVSVEAKGVLDAAGVLPPPTVYLCLDIEATCDGKAVNGKRQFRQDFMNEILEIPVEVVDAKTGQNISDRLPGWRFHTYVNPETPPTPFCTELTGIDDATLANAPSLHEALRRLEAWLRRRSLVPWPLANLKEGEHNFIWVTDGSWDFGKFLWHDCNRKGLVYPFSCNGWCDAREAFRQTWPQIGLKAPILQNMVSNVGLSWSGKPHRGHVDTKNLAALVGVLVNCNPTALLPSRCIPYHLLPQVPMTYPVYYPAMHPYAPASYPRQYYRPKVPTADRAQHLGLIPLHDYMAHDYEHEYEQQHHSVF